MSHKHVIFKKISRDKSVSKHHSNKTSISSTRYVSNIRQ